MTANDVAAWAWVLFYVGRMVVDRRRPEDARPTALDRLLDGLAAIGVTLVLLPPLPGWPLGRPWLAPGPSLGALGLMVTGIGLAVGASALGGGRRERRPRTLHAGILLAAAGTMLTGADQSAVPGIGLLVVAVAAKMWRLNNI